MELILPGILMAAAGIFILWLVIKLFLTPIKWIFKLLINTGIGFVCLWVLNYFGAFFGISLGLNWVNALVVGVFGFPGLVLLLLIKYLI